MLKGQMRSKLRWDSDTKEYRVQHKQDRQPFLDAAKRRRDVEEAGGIRKDAELTKFASIPMTVVLEIRDKHGIDLMSANREDLRRACKLIEREYPLLKTTNTRIG